jgi:hypothetical protein
VVDFHEIQDEVPAIEGDLDTIIFNIVTETVPKLTFRILRWIQNFHQSTW